jgi:hypothetical protein
VGPCLAHTAYRALTRVVTVLQVATRFGQILGFRAGDHVWPGVVTPARLCHAGTSTCVQQRLPDLSDLARSTVQGTSTQARQAEAYPDVHVHQFRSPCSGTRRGREGHTRTASDSGSEAERRQSTRFLLSVATAGWLRRLVADGVAALGIGRRGQRQGTVFGRSSSRAIHILNSKSFGEAVVRTTYGPPVARTCCPGSSHTAQKRKSTCHHLRTRQTFQVKPKVREPADGGSPLLGLQS